MRRKSEIREVIQGPFGVILPSIPAAKICCLRFSEIRGSLPSSRLDEEGVSRSSRHVRRGCDGRFGDARDHSCGRTAPRRTQNRVVLVSRC
jgi:hypothetical protein